VINIDPKVIAPGTVGTGPDRPVQHHRPKDQPHRQTPRVTPASGAHLPPTKRGVLPSSSLYVFARDGRRRLPWRARPFAVDMQNSRIIIPDVPSALRLIRLLRRAPPAAFLLPEVLLHGLGDGGLEPPGGAGVGQRRRGCLLDGGAGLQPGLRPGEPGAQRVDGGGAGLYAGAPGVLVAGGLDRGVDPANAVPLGRGQRGKEGGPDAVQDAEAFPGQTDGLCPLWPAGAMLTRPSDTGRTLLLWITPSSAGGRNRRSARESPRCRRGWT
jgi:hypothetical protein